MIITYQGLVVTFPGATASGAQKLGQTMAFALEQFERDGRPNSGDHA